MTWTRRSFLKALGAAVVAAQVALPRFGGEEVDLEPVGERVSWSVREEQKRLAAEWWSRRLGQTFEDLAAGP